MPGKQHRGREFKGIVEGQMRRWELTQSEDAISEARARAASREIDYITISRQPGSGGDQVARILTEMVQWELYDKQILDFMSENMNVQQDVLKKMDEQSTGWVEDFFSPVFSDKPVNQMNYYRHLVRVLFLIAQEGKAIILGRCAAMVLPRDRGLNVRIAAPFELRVQRFGKENELEPKDAREEVERLDRKQEEFVKNFLNKRARDAKYYDLICNTEKLTPESVAKLIWRTMDLRRMAD